MKTHNKEFFNDQIASAAKIITSKCKLLVHTNLRNIEFWENLVIDGHDRLVELGARALTV